MLVCASVYWRVVEFGITWLGNELLHLLLLVQIFLMLGLVLVELKPLLLDKGPLVLLFGVHQLVFGM